jgi:hypothetical protein
MKGGNTAEFYAREGTVPKSNMLHRLHPDVCRTTWRYGRYHHYVDYTPFERNRLARRPDLEVPEGVDEYGLQLVGTPKRRKAA